MERIFHCYLLFYADIDLTNVLSTRQDDSSLSPDLNFTVTLPVKPLGHSYSHNRRWKNFDLGTISYREQQAPVYRTGTELNGGRYLARPCGGAYGSNYDGADSSDTRYRQRRQL